MADRWLPGAVRLPSDHGGGTYVGGPPRVVWHRTAGGTFASNRSYLRSTGFEPHLLWDPRTGALGQFLPADRSAYALRHPSGSVQTNRQGSVCLQIEVVDHGQTWDITDTPLLGLERILAWLDGWGVPRVWPLGPPSPLSGPRAGGNAQTWLRKAGHYGHCHVPGNTHVDPGRLDVARLTPPLVPARPNQEEDPMPTVEQLVQALRPVVREEVEAVARTILGRDTNGTDADPTHYALNDVRTQLGRLGQQVDVVRADTQALRTKTGA